MRLTRVRIVDRAMSGLGALATIGAVAFMLVPPLLTAVLSFSNDGYFGFPPSSWGLRQYRTLFSDPTWSAALGLSFKIAVPVAVASVLIAVPTTFVVYRSTLPLRHLLQVLGLAGVIVPITALAVALYGMFAAVGLLGTTTGLIIANTVIAVPMTLVVTGAAMSRIPRELELAAMVAGAPRWRAWWGVTVPLLGPAILSGALLAFVASFDEAVLINFLGGPGLTTLPKAILDSARLGINPVIMAIATLLMVTTGGLMLFMMLIFKRGD